MRNVVNIDARGTRAADTDILQRSAMIEHYAMVDMEQGSDESKSTLSTGAIDFAFLAEQTFGDRSLEREVLLLFDAQARRISSTLADLPARAQAEAVHLLKGSALGIGAWQAAAMAERYEAAPLDSRHAILLPLIEGYAAAIAEIEAYLSPGSPL